MPITILMPALSPTMTEGHLVKWHKTVGESVSPGDLLMEIETDKAVMEVEATQKGIIAHIFISAPAESIAVGRVIALLKEENEELTEEILSKFQIDAFSENHSSPKISDELPQPKECDLKSSSKEFAAKEANLPKDDVRISVSPLARKLAGQRNLDLSKITGSGPRGRIVKNDVDGIFNNQIYEAKQNDDSKNINNEVTYIPLTPMRKTIAQRLALSKQTIPHFYISVDCLMDDLLLLRKQINESFGSKLFSINDFMVRACALALSSVTEMNTLWNDTNLMSYSKVDLAVAVSVEGGLITPIVRAAETKSLKTLSVELKNLIQMARAGKLSPKDYHGGTFTITNLGMWGIDEFCPIVNPPHSGILAIGASKEKPVIKNGSVSIGSVITATVAADHRVIDGEVAARFLTLFRKLVESPYQLII